MLVLRGVEDERRQAEWVRWHAHGACRSEDGATPRRDYSFSSKKVRAKDSTSPQSETSRFVRSLRDRAGRGKASRIRRRSATKADGAHTPKRADLSLFRI